MKKRWVLLLFTLFCITSACKSKQEAGRNPYDDIDRSYEEHMERNQDTYDEDPPDLR
jgi:hypothetical protein